MRVGEGPGKLQIPFNGQTREGALGVGEIIRPRVHVGEAQIIERRRERDREREMGGLILYWKMDWVRVIFCYCPFVAEHDISKRVRSSRLKINLHKGKSAF